MLLIPDKLTKINKPSNDMTTNQKSILPLSSTVIIQGDFKGEFLNNFFCFQLCASLGGYSPLDFSGYFIDQTANNAYGILTTTECFGVIKIRTTVIERKKKQ